MRPFDDENAGRARTSTPTSRCWSRVCASGRLRSLPGISTRGWRGGSRRGRRSAARADGRRRWRRWLSLPALGGAGRAGAWRAVAAVVVVPRSGGGGLPSGPLTAFERRVRHPGDQPWQGRPTRQQRDRIGRRSGNLRADRGLPSRRRPPQPGSRRRPRSEFGDRPPLPAPNAGTGAKQIQSAQISLSVTERARRTRSRRRSSTWSSNEHGNVQNSKITAATRTRAAATRPSR